MGIGHLRNGNRKFRQIYERSDEDRLNKVQACINLNKAMFYHDYEYQDKIMEFVDTTLSDKNDIIQDMAKRAILNCFSKISMTKTAEFAKKKKYENINVYASGNKVLLSTANYKSKYAENPEILKRDTEKLYDLSQHIPMEISSLEALIEERQQKRVVDKANDEKAKKDDKSEQERKEKEYKEQQNKQDQGARIGETNLSIFKQMGEETKVLLVMGLAGILCFGLYFAFNSLSVTTSELNKKKKAKKN